MKEEDKEAQIKYQKELQDAAMQIVSGEFDIKEYYGISNEGLDAIYTVGHEMYKHKQYEEAKGVFTILCTLEPTSIKYLSACGSTYFMLEDYLNASQFFRLALINGDYTPKTLLRLAECTIKLELLELTERYLRELIRIAAEEKFKNDKESQAYEARAQMMLAVVTAQLQKQQVIK
ncbi:MAG: tetratricopeptide repeat protein [Puniceicoccales bacterium]|jgi:tetratricopeptide (TPR) repeat protein|nr:tetratricopeptide repeat protein [Puniceicoccales bacterium]